MNDARVSYEWPPGECLRQEVLILLVLPARAEQWLSVRPGLHPSSKPLPLSSNHSSKLDPVYPERHAKGAPGAQPNLLRAVFGVRRLVYPDGGRDAAFLRPAMAGRAADEWVTRGHTKVRYADNRQSMAQ